eukprot:364775-Chlamydomonas_euryale.AAC.15
MSHTHTRLDASPETVHVVHTFKQRSAVSSVAVAVDCQPDTTTHVLKTSLFNWRVCAVNLRIRSMDKCCRAAAVPLCRPSAGSTTHMSCRR